MSDVLSCQERFEFHSLVANGFGLCIITLQYWFSLILCVRLRYRIRIIGQRFVLKFMIMMAAEFWV